MKSIAQICALLSVAGFTTAFVLALLMIWDCAKRLRGRTVRSFLPVLTLFAVSMILLGAAPVFSELAKQQHGVSRAPGGLMLFIFCGAAGIALFLSVVIAWLITRRGKV